MIFEALSTLTDSNGSDLNAIVSFIEVCYRIKTPVETKPPAPEQIDSSPRQSLPSGITSSHESVMHAEKIAVVKVPQNYRRAADAMLRKLVDQGKLEKVESCYRIKTPVDAEVIAALVADLEHKSHLAAEALKKAEKATELVKEADAKLTLKLKKYLE